MVAIVAVMKKILLMLRAMLIKKTMFNPEYTLDS